MKKLTVQYRLIGSSTDTSWLRAIFNNEVEDSIIDFVYEYGGTSTLEYCFVLGDVIYAINNFLPINSSQNTSIRTLLSFIRDPDEDYCRNDLLPFAQDAGAAVYLVSTGGEDKGQVFLFLGGFEKPLFKISDSFEEFINSLQPAPSA